MPARDRGSQSRRLACLERSDVAEVLLAATGRLHRDQLVVACIERTVDLDGSCAEVVIVAKTGNVLHHVETPETRLEHPVAAGAQSLLVRLDPQLVRIDVAEIDLRLQRLQRAREPREVCRRGLRDDVDVLGRAHIAVRSEGEGADDHELNARIAQRTKEQFGVQSPRRTRSRFRAVRPLRLGLALSPRHVGLSLAPQRQR